MKLHKIVMIVSLFFIASITDLLSMPSHDIQTNRPIPKQPKIVMHRNGDILITTQNEDDTTTETIVFADKIKVIKTKDAHNKFISIKTYDDQDDLIQFDTRNPDDTITSTIYNPDSTKSIAKYSTNKNLISLTKFDHQDHIIQSQINNSDGTITITNFYSNGSQFISVYNAKEVISYASISAHGKKISMDGKLVLAWHEAAHAVSTINNKSLEAIHEVEILPKKSDAAIDSYAGSNTVMQTYLIKNNNQELENRIITSLAGGVAQQIVLSQDMLTNPLDILHFFSQFEYNFDISIAHEAAQEIISQNYPKLSHVQMQKQINDKIVSLYKKTYQFVTEKKADIEKLANVLIEQKTMSGDAVHDRLKADKPLYNFQEGPLPLNLIEDYKLRGWTENTEQRIPLYDKNKMATTIDPRRDTSDQKNDGTTIETQYYFNGDKAMERHITRDNRKIETKYNPDSSQSIKIFGSTGTLINEKIIPAPTKETLNQAITNA